MIHIYTHTKAEGCNNCQASSPSCCWEPSVNGRLEHSNISCHNLPAVLHIFIAKVWDQTYWHWMYLIAKNKVAIWMSLHDMIDNWAVVQLMVWAQALVPVNISNLDCLLLLLLIR